MLAGLYDGGLAEPVLINDVVVVPMHGYGAWRLAVTVVQWGARCACAEEVMPARLRAFFVSVY